jgi:beta-phosphoglucomutase-like phosphatase (HAD superfamily)
MPWPDLVIFDCDGVLVDSELIALELTRAALGEAGLALTHAEAIDRFLGFSLDSIIQGAEAELSGALPAGFREDLSRDILARFAAELKGVTAFAWRCRSPVTTACSSPISFPRPWLRAASRIRTCFCTRRARWAPPPIDAW